MCHSLAPQLLRPALRPCVLPAHAVPPGLRQHRVCLLAVLASCHHACGDVLQGIPLAAPALALLVQVAQGLRHMHASGVVHGDVSASNVLLSSDGNAFLACLTGVWVCCPCNAQRSANFQVSRCTLRLHSAAAGPMLCCVTNVMRCPATQDAISSSSRSTVHTCQGG